MSEIECVARASRALGKPEFDDGVRACTAQAVQQLIHEDNLCQLVHSHSGTMLALSSEIYDVEDDTLTKIAVVPKLVVCGLITVLWIISPIDLIPDWIPFIGELDDVTVALLFAGMVFKSKNIHSWKHLKEPPTSVLRSGA